jgi:hypothetical protein
MRQANYTRAPPRSASVEPTATEPDPAVVQALSSGHPSSSTLPLYPSNRGGEDASPTSPRGIRKPLDRRTISDESLVRRSKWSPHPKSMAGIVTPD